MKVPQSKIGPWARELIDECEASRKSRIQAGATWRSWYLLGSDTGVPARYNKCYPHIQRLSSYLYSPVDVQLTVEMEKAMQGEWKEELSHASSILSRAFHARGLDVAFGEAVDWSLIKGSCFAKPVWGHDGIDCYVVQPEMLAVLREDIDDLNRQEAFVHTTYMTTGMLKRMLTGKSNAAEILKKAKSQAKKSADDPARDDMFKQVIIGGVNPISTTPTDNPAGGIVRWMDHPGATISPYVLADLVRVDELWVQDTDRQDYTTIQLLEDNVVLHGDMQHTNLCGIEGHHPFVRVCPNALYGYIWGRSELANLWPLQDAINKRLQGIEDMWRLQEDNPLAFSGFSGVNDERMARLKQPGGWIAEEAPTGKIENLAPKLPEGTFQELQQLIAFFDDIGGMTPTLMGHGESGVRAQAHAETLVRTSSPQVRDRALVVERQLEDLGDLAFRLLQAHDATAVQMKPAGGGILGALRGKKANGAAAFVLSQLPDDFHITVDSHSASPAFSEEAERRAFALNQRGAIDGVDLLRLTQVQHKDSLIAAAQARQEAEAALMQQHPELLGKGGKRGH